MPNFGFLSQWDCKVYGESLASLSSLGMVSILGHVSVVSQRVLSVFVICLFILAEVDELRRLLRRWPHGAAAELQMLCRGGADE